VQSVNCGNLSELQTQGLTMHNALSPNFVVVRVTTNNFFLADFMPLLLRVGCEGFSHKS